MVSLIEKISRSPLLVFFVILSLLVNSFLFDQFIETEALKLRVDSEKMRLTYFKSRIVNRMAYTRMLQMLKESQNITDSYLKPRKYQEVRMQLEAIAPNMTFNHLSTDEEGYFDQEVVTRMQFQGVMISTLENIKQKLWRLSTNGNFDGPFIQPNKIRLEGVKELDNNEIKLVFIFDVIGYQYEE